MFDGSLFCCQKSKTDESLSKADGAAAVPAAKEEDVPASRVLKMAWEDSPFYLIVGLIGSTFQGVYLPLFSLVFGTCLLRACVLVGLFD